MRIAAVEVQHGGDVARVQPSWHCLLRFRQRKSTPPGTDEAVSALRDALIDAEISRVPPGWAAGQDAERWAIPLSGDLAFPLARSRGETWTALTCLTRST